MRVSRVLVSSWDSKYIHRVTKNRLFFFFSFLDCRSIKDSIEECESNEKGYPYKRIEIFDTERRVWEINTWRARLGGKILSTFNCAMFTSWPVIILFGTRRL